MSAAAAALGGRARTRTRGKIPRRWFSRRRLAAIVLAAVALAAAYQFWFRDSSLVAVKTVKVDGIPPGSYGSAQLEQALKQAAGKMTTLHVRPDLFRAAAKPFPQVRSISAEASFPSTLTIRVTERSPASLIGEGRKTVAVAGDGTLLRGLPADGLLLARLPLEEPPDRARLRGQVLQQAKVLGAAPAALRPYLLRSGWGEGGVRVELVGGIELRFGDPSQALLKWRAAAAVLADPGLDALDYVDLTAPRRPAVGGSGHTLPPLP